MISRRQIIERGTEPELDLSKIGGERQRASEMVVAKRVERNRDREQPRTKLDNERIEFRGFGKTRREPFKMRARQEEAPEEELEEELEIGGSNEDEDDYEQETIGQDYRHFDPYSVYGEEDEEEDVWYSEERLFEDHLQEIIDKWMAIDDEIWAKIICMERNRRVAKAYARKHSLTVNGSHDEYLDGTSLGLNSFENPDRDAKTRHIKQQIGHGLRIKITASGDIVVRRLSKSGVFVHQVNSPGEKQVQLSGAHASSQDIYGAFEEPNTDNGLYGVATSVAPHSSSSSFSALCRAPMAAGQIQQKSQQKSSRLYAGGSKSDEAASHASSSSSSGVIMSSSLNGPTKGGQKWSPVASGAAKHPPCVHLSRSSGELSTTLVGHQQLQTKPLDFNESAKVFNMNQFKLLLEEESRKPRPNRKFLQQQCISVISFVVDDQKLLNLPAWIMVINIVAIDLLRSELGLLELQDLELLRPPPPPPLPLDEDEDEFELYSPRRHNQLAASKKAFADAAASGAYNNSGHYSAGSQVREKALNEPVNGKKQPQQQASSSGFNSNCSSQNNSSAASSSSNLVEQQARTLAQQEEDKQHYGEARSQKRNPFAAAVNNNNNDNQEQKQMDELERQPRGKRPPKLPHRTQAVVQQTSKANLILVAPTGLSPPLPKRKGPPLVVGAAREQFHTIKLIDENGQCSLIKAPSDHKQQLPAGIPAHAQLAPPATQRHILNYLRAAATANTANSSSPARPHRRPLPQAPPHLAPDESLYYCGLQARVPAHRQQQRRPNTRPIQLPLPPPRHPVSTSAINAILRDFKRASQQHHLYQSPHFRHQFSLTNLSANSSGQQPSELIYGSAQYLQQAQNAVERTKTSSSSSSKTSGFIRFFSRSSNKRQATEVGSDPDKDIMFLSADNLTSRQQASSGRILGLLPRSQKVSKVKAPLQS